MPTRPPIHRPAFARTPQKSVYLRDGRPTTSTGYDNMAWRKLRASFLKSHPLCARCEREGHLTAAEQVHHKLPVATHHELKMSWENLESLCASCHSKETAREQASVR